MNTPRTVYAAKCYWPGVTERELTHAATRAAAATEAAGSVRKLEPPLEGDP
jgi:hypothetical protein